MNEKHNRSQEVLEIAKACAVAFKGDASLKVNDKALRVMSKAAASASGPDAPGSDDEIREAMATALTRAKDGISGEAHFIAPNAAFRKILAELFPGAPEPEPEPEEGEEAEAE